MNFPHGSKSVKALQYEGCEWVSMDDLADSVGCTIKVSSLSGRVVMSYGRQQMTGFEGSNKLLTGDKQAIDLEKPIWFNGEAAYMEISSLPSVLERMFGVAVRWKKPMEELEIGSVLKMASVKSVTMDRPIVRSLKKVVIDPGHGGHDFGGRGKGLSDKEIALAVAKRLKKSLEERGIEVVMTREGDTFIPLADRVTVANQAEADLYLSIHANWNPSSKASGSEVYIFNFYASNKEASEVAERENEGMEGGALDTILRDLSKRSDDEVSILAAGHVLDALQSKIPFHHRHQDILRAPFFVLSHANMPAMLVEVGYLSNPKELKMMKKEDTRDQMAEALLQGVLAYKEALERGKVTATK